MGTRLLLPSRLRSEQLVSVGSSLLLFCLSFWLFSLYVTPIQGVPLSSDLPAHLTVARQFAADERALVHPGFHYTILFLARVTGLSLETAAPFALGLATSLSYLTVSVILTSYLSAHYPSLTLAGFAFILSTVSALYVPFFNTNVYLGQGTPNIWHNPTWIMMQPFALWSFFLTERCLHAPTWRQALPLASGGAFCLLGSVFMKPNFALAFIPALGLYTVLHRGRTQSWLLRLTLSSVIVGLALPLLWWQYASRYGADESHQASLLVAPFVVWGAKTPSITISALLTLAFPITVLLLRPYRFSQQPGFLLAWLLIGIAFLQRAFLAESGFKMEHGNWAWGYFIALKIVFIYSVIVLARKQKKEEANARIGVRLAWAVLALHLGSGLFYLGRLFSGLGFI
jgi:hypothetical protein